MTKSLTDKWKDMDLADEHLYYWRMPNGEVRIMTKMGVYSYKLCYDGGEIDILAPVPSYEEWKKLDDELMEIATKNDTICMENGRLQERLAIATKALERIYQPAVGDIYNFETDELDHTKLQDIACKAIKEIKEVK